MIIDLWEKIKRQEEDSKTQCRPQNNLCECDDEVSSRFRRHERRARKLRILVGRTVVYVLVWLLRWKCENCKKSFTEYPDFVARHKRYAVHHMQDLGKKYVTTMDMSYEKVVLNDGMAISHVGSGDEFIDHRLAGSTVWRWLGDWGKQQGILSMALSMVMKKSPQSMAVRDMQPVQRKKYRSPERKCALESFLRMFPIALEYWKLFEKKIFPSFAIIEGGL